MVATLSARYVLKHLQVFFMLQMYVIWRVVLNVAPRGWATNCISISCLKVFWVLRTKRLKSSNQALRFLGLAGSTDGWVISTRSCMQLVVLMAPRWFCVLASGGCQHPGQRLGSGGPGKTHRATNSIAVKVCIRIHPRLSNGFFFRRKQALPCNAYCKHIGNWFSSVSLKRRYQTWWNYPTTMVCKRVSERSCASWVLHWFVWTLMSSVMIMKRLKGASVPLDL